ncbi:uncharacterized protein CLUP02_18372 [Colletotrichum lupini]|uniref:Uncharacterized protein n=1 Tax=Colletotrichum lupini TaxID=145971 RepID=A0A9Q8SGA6_9PEZI|nr:uncharacterized protein CLUP02_18372 [Colletotrichum lupini]UQC76857.1 hypothetical protein CLUP02_18372 [Colletotrichum lupini]
MNLFEVILLRGNHNDWNIFRIFGYDSKKFLSRFLHWALIVDFETKPDAVLELATTGGEGMEILPDSMKTLVNLSIPLFFSQKLPHSLELSGSSGFKAPRIVYDEIRPSRPSEFILDIMLTSNVIRAFGHLFTIRHAKDLIDQ